MIFVESASLLVHQRIARPGLRNERHHRVAERITPLNEELERIVEAGGVRLAFIRNRPQLRDVGAEEFRGDARLTRRHPVDITPQGVDFAVVRDVR